MRFIRDDIRVRDLDKRYKKVMRRYTSSFVSANSGGYSWNMAQNIPIWNWAVRVESVSLKGA